MKPLIIIKRKSTSINKKILSLRNFIKFLFYLSITSQAIAQNSKIKFEYQTEKFDGRFDCNTSTPCQIPFRLDYKEYLDLKYNHKRKIVYHLDNGGYYYFGYNPTKGKELAFDLKIRVHFTKISKGNKTAEIELDTQTQSGQIYVTSSGSAKPSWKYLLSETPTLSPVIAENQIFVSADHPVEGGKLYCLNSNTGKLEWFFLTPGAILAYPFIYENFILIIDDSGNIFWVDRETGHLSFKYTMEEFPISNPILKDKILYLAGQRGHIYGLKLFDARLVWKDLALIGDLVEMFPQKTGFILLGGNQYWLFNYSNGAKQDKVSGKHSFD